jgi:hypothetical protein
MVPIFVGFVGVVAFRIQSLCREDSDFVSDDVPLAIGVNKFALRPLRVRAVCVNALVRICARGDQRWSSLPRQSAG